MGKLADSDSGFPVLKLSFSWDITLFRASLAFALVFLAIAIFFGNFFVDRNRQYGLKIILFLSGASSALALESLAQQRYRRELNSLSSKEPPSSIYEESLTVASPEREESKSTSTRSQEESKSTSTGINKSKEGSSSSYSTQSATKVTLYLPPELHRKLKIRSAVEGEAMSAITEQALSFYIDHWDAVEKIRLGQEGVFTLETLEQSQQVRESKEEPSAQSGSSIQK